MFILLVFDNLRTAEIVGNVTKCLLCEKYVMDDTAVNYMYFAEVLYPQYHSLSRSGCLIDSKKAIPPTHVRFGFLDYKCNFYYGDYNYLPRSGIKTSIILI